MKLHIINFNDKQYSNLLEFVNVNIIYRISYTGLFNVYRYTDMEQAKLNKFI